VFVLFVLCIFVVFVLAVSLKRMRLGHLVVSVPTFPRSCCLLCCAVDSVLRISLRGLGSYLRFYLVSLFVFFLLSSIYTFEI
jgi:hypothetical protein